MKTNWLWAAGVLLVCGCASKNNEEDNDQARAQFSGKPAQKVDQKIVAAQNEFGFELLRQLDNANRNQENLVFSPLSISLSISALNNGAAGSTQKEIQRTLKLGAYSLDEINRANSALLFNLQSTGPNIETRIASSLWTRAGIKFEKAFLERSAKYYDAKITSLDLSTPAAIDAINKWASEKTSDKITRIAEQPFDSQTALVLLNAIYFKGQWQEKFDKSQTEDGDFHLPNGETIRVPMMNRDGEYFHLQEKSFSAVALPYGAGSLSLVVMLPEKNASLAAVIQTLNAKSWSTLLHEMSSREGHVSLPRFKIESETQLKSALSTLGMGEAFSSRANFSAMTKQTPMFLSTARQKAIIEVNEEGTEAAAVTEMDVAAADNVAEDKPFEFIANHPFFAALYDNRSGSILFFVVVRDPR